MLGFECDEKGASLFRLNEQDALRRARGMQANRLLVTILVALTGTAAAAQAPPKTRSSARAKSFELDTPYVPPPGDPLMHHAAGYAKVVCSAVFLTGLAPDFAAGNVGFFTARPTDSAARITIEAFHGMLFSATLIESPSK
jgi:hypothetical protein